MKYQFPGARKFHEVAKAKTGTDVPFTKLTECDPFNRVASLAAMCVGNDAAHVAQTVPLMRKELVALQFVAAAASLMIDDLLDHFPEIDARDFSSGVDGSNFPSHHGEGEGRESACGEGSHGGPQTDPGRPTHSAESEGFTI